MVRPLQTLIDKLAQTADFIYPEGASGTQFVAGLADGLLYGVRDMFTILDHVDELPGSPIAMVRNFVGGVRKLYEALLGLDSFRNDVANVTFAAGKASEMFGSMMSRSLPENAQLLVASLLRAADQAYYANADQLEDRVRASGREPNSDLVDWRFRGEGLGYIGAMFLPIPGARGASSVKSAEGLGGGLRDLSRLMHGEQSALAWMDRYTARYMAMRGEMMVALRHHRWLGRFLRQPSVANSLVKIATNVDTVAIPVVERLEAILGHLTPTVLKSKLEIVLPLIESITDASRMGSSFTAELLDNLLIAVRELPEKRFADLVAEVRNLSPENEFAMMTVTRGARNGELTKTVNATFGDVSVDPAALLVRDFGGVFRFSSDPAVHSAARATFDRLLQHVAMLKANPNHRFGSGVAGDLTELAYVRAEEHARATGIGNGRAHGMNQKYRNGNLGETDVMMEDLLAGERFPTNVKGRLNPQHPLPDSVVRDAIYQQHQLFVGENATPEFTSGPWSLLGLKQARIVSQAEMDAVVLSNLQAQLDAGLPWTVTKGPKANPTSVIRSVPRGTKLIPDGQVGEFFRYRMIFP